jgi:hypothetical protein
LNCKEVDKVFQEARNDQGTTILDGLGYETCICLGVKISKDNATGEIKIYDPSKSINYYIEIEQPLYKLFKSLGWKKAVLTITLDKYKDKLERIKRGINKEMNASQSQKRLNFFKESRKQILKKYYKLTVKLNQL